MDEVRKARSNPKVAGQSARAAVHQQLFPVSIVADGEELSMTDGGIRYPSLAPFREERSARRRSSMFKNIMKTADPIEEDDMPDYVKNIHRHYLELSQLYLGTLNEVAELRNEREDGTTLEDDKNKVEEVFQVEQGGGEGGQNQVPGRGSGKEYLEELSRRILDDISKQKIDNGTLPPGDLADKDKWDGTAEKLEFWLHQVESKITLNPQYFDSELRKTTWALAQTQEQLRGYVFSIGKKRHLVTKWETLKDHIKNTRGSRYSFLQQAEKLYKLTQTGELETFAAQWEELQLSLGRDFDDYVGDFFVKLDPEVKMYFKMQGFNCTEKYGVLKAKAQTIWDVISQNRATCSDQDQKHFQGSHTKSFKAGQKVKANSNVNIPAAEFAHRKAENLCFKCGKPNHQAKNCRSRNKNKAPQQSKSTADNTNKVTEGASDAYLRHTGFYGQVDV